MDQKGLEELLEKITLLLGNKKPVNILLTASLSDWEWLEIKRALEERSRGDSCG